MLTQALQALLPGRTPSTPDPKTISAWPTHTPSLLAVAHAVPCSFTTLSDQLLRLTDAAVAQRSTLQSYAYLSRLASKLLPRGTFLLEFSPLTF